MLSRLRHRLRRMLRTRALRARGRSRTRRPRWVPGADGLHVRVPRATPDELPWTAITEIGVERVDGLALYDALTIHIGAEDVDWVIHEEHPDFRAVEAALAERFELGEFWTQQATRSGSPASVVVWPTSRS